MKRGIKGNKGIQEKDIKESRYTKVGIYRDKDNQGINCYN